MTGRAKKRIALLAGAVVLLAAMASGAYAIKQAHTHKLMDQWLTEGMASYKEGNYETAMGLLGNYVGRSKKNEEAIMALADCRRRLPMENGKHIIIAIGLVNAAAKLNPLDPAPLEMLLDLYGQARFLTERLQVADSLLSLQKDNHNALDAKVVTLALLGRVAEARKAAVAMTVAHPQDVHGHEYVIQLMTEMREEPKVICKYADDTAAQYKDDPAFVMMQSKAHFATGDAQGAVVLAKQLAAMPVKSAEGLGGMLLLLDGLSSTDPSLVTAADDVLAREMNGPLAHEVAAVAAERSWKAGQPERAREHAAKAVDLSKPQAAATDALGWWIFLGTASGKGLDDAELKPALDELRKRTGTVAAYWTSLCEGTAALSEGNLAKAHEQFELAATAGYKPDIAEYLMGDVLQREGEWRQAEMSWERLALTQPSWRVIHMALVTLLLQHDQAEEAVQAADRALEARRGSISEAIALTRALTALLESGRAKPQHVETALSVAEALEKDAKDNALAQSLVARIYLNAGKPERGVQVIREMIAKTPPPPPDILASVAYSVRTKDPVLADQVMSMARVAGGTPELDLQAACQLADAGKPEDGRALLQRSVEAHKGADHLAYELRMAAYLDRIKDPQAAATFAKLAEANPTEPAVQLAVLDSESAWKDEAIVSAAIGRLHQITGDGAVEWNIHEARRLIAFSPSPANAAKAIKENLTFALHKDPNNALAMALSAEANLLLGNRSEAIRLLGRAVDVEPDRSRAYPRLIELLQQSGSAKEAADRLTAFSRIDSLPPSLLRQRAKLLAAQGMWDQAADDFAKLVPGGAVEDRFALGVVLSRKGDAVGARQNLDAVLQSPKLTEPMVVSIADYAADQGDVDRGQKILEEHLPADASGHRAAVMAAFFERYDRLPQAEQQYLEQAKDGKAESLAELAKFYYKQGKIEEAKAAVDRGLAIAPKNNTLQQVAGFIKLSKGSSREAMSDIAGSMNSLEDSSPLKQLAAALQELEKNPADTEGFLKRLEAITKENPGFFPAWKLLAEGRFQRGEVKDAIEAALTATRSSPTDPRPARLTTNLLMAAGEYDQALRMAQVWRQRSIIQPFEADVGIATINGAQKHFDEGLRQLDPWKGRIIAEADSAPVRLQLLAELLANAGRVQEAQDLVWPRADKDPTWALRCLDIAANLPGPVQEKWVARMSPLLDKSAAGQMALGKVLFKVAQKSETKANYERAIAMFNKAVDDTTFRSQAAFFLASCYEQISDKPNAIRYYRVAIDTNPKDALSLNNLAFLLTDDSGTASEAAVLAQKAVDLGSVPGFDANLLGSFLDTLGVALLKCGKAEEAEKVFRKGLAMNPNALDLNVGLAAARLDQGFPEDARVIVRRLDAQTPTGSPQDTNLAKRLADVKHRLQDAK